MMKTVYQRLQGDFCACSDISKYDPLCIVLQCIDMYSTRVSSLLQYSQSFRKTFSSLGSVGSFGLMVIVCISRFELLDPILS